MSQKVRKNAILTKICHETCPKYCKNGIYLVIDYYFRRFLSSFLGFRVAAFLLGVWETFGWGFCPSVPLLEDVPPAMEDGTAFPVSLAWVPHGFRWRLAMGLSSGVPSRGTGSNTKVYCFVFVPAERGKAWVPRPLSLSPMGDGKMLSSPRADCWRLESRIGHFKPR